MCLLGFMGVENIEAPLNEALWVYSVFPHIMKTEYHLNSAQLISFASYLNAGSGGRTHMAVRPHAPETCASTSFAIPAQIYHYCFSD